MVNWKLSSLPKLRNKVDCKLSYLFISAKSLLFCRILEWGLSPFILKLGSYVNR